MCIYIYIYSFSGLGVACSACGCFVFSEVRSTPLGPPPWATAAFGGGARTALGHRRRHLGARGKGGGKPQKTTQSPNRQ